MIPLKNAVPSRYPPVVTWILIATNCLVFLFQNSLSPLELEMFLRDFALIPARYTAALAYGELTLGDFVPMFTMMFLVRQEHRGRKPVRALNAPAGWETLSSTRRSAGSEADG